MPPDPMFSESFDDFRAGKPGIYKGIEEDDYHAHPAVSNSRLSAFRVSPRKMKYQMERSHEPTPAQLFGTAAHAALLEPDKFEEEFHTPTQCAAITKRGTQCSNIGVLMDPTTGLWYCKIHASEICVRPRYVVSPDDREAVTSMAKWCHTFPGTKGLLVDKDGEPRGEREVSILWEVEGVLAKCRIDLLCLDGDASYALDYKTTASLETGFGIMYLKSRHYGPMDDAITTSTAIYKWGYHRQGAFYTDALAYHGVEVDHFVFLVQEKPAPYECVALRLYDEAMAIGREEYKLEAAEYGKLLEKDHWPSAAPTRVIEVDLPRWVYGNESF